MYSGQFFLMTVESSPTVSGFKKRVGKVWEERCWIWVRHSPLWWAPVFSTAWTLCNARKNQNNLENQNANPKRRQGALISTRKLYGVRKLKKHRAEPTVGWAGGTTIHFLFEGLSFPSSWEGGKPSKIGPVVAFSLSTSFVRGRGKNGSRQQGQEEEELLLNTSSCSPVLGSGRPGLEPQICSFLVSPWQVTSHL